MMMKLLSTVLLLLLVINKPILAMYNPTFFPDHIFKDREPAQARQAAMDMILKFQPAQTYTEATNLDTDGYVWVVSYKRYNADSDITLLNPHPTLTALNQRATEIAKKEIRTWLISETDETYLLEKGLTQQDINTIKNTKREIHINFDEFEKVAIPKIKEQLTNKLSSFECSYAIKTNQAYQGYVKVHVGASGRVTSVYMDLNDDNVRRCLFHQIRQGRYMILNQDGVPVSYSFSVAFDLVIP